jgi:hypothetical protein
VKQVAWGTCDHQFPVTLTLVLTTTNKIAPPKKNLTEISTRNLPGG